MEIVSDPGPRRPWPELLSDHRPVLVLPADPGRLPVPEDGWADRDTAPAPGTDPNSGWSAVLDGYWLTVRRPSGTVWFDGETAATREWIRSVRAHGTLLLITGPFTNVFDFWPAAATGQLFFLTTPIRLADGP
ncbi:hypothetical protein [Kitasatospora sp. MBT66]|uniref:hypothetical protein n=1 Tax=Kitasatospora sp. MBT66 TaxID=1444769 RepID=UPI0005BB6596|nr:hypothetical protein [Kitasatospora sp. MBT66]